MSFANVAPEFVVTATSDLVSIGSAINAANATAPPITQLLATAQHEVSAAIAAVGGAHAQQYQALSARAAEIPGQFVQGLTRDVPNAPILPLFGMPVDRHRPVGPAPTPAPPACRPS
ncbi:PE family protein [Mycobacterium basiliense]|uniref:PE family protein n=1 Tax=Mycobacterium basiliense TaxID=2094119 RepID=A0A3S4BF00_9MYCO|nr:PE family protein [Mycobacterium basiliense]VDM88524.1 PE family protein [Mycobacterium basiliense]